MTTPTMLPTAVLPSAYDLTLQPDLESFTFQGEEDVVLTIHEPTSEIVMNADELEIQAARLTVADGRKKVSQGLAPHLDEHCRTAPVRSVGVGLLILLRLNRT